MIVNLLKIMKYQKIKLLFLYLLYFYKIIRKIKNKYFYNGKPICLFLKFLVISE
jgi:hypothetical protein